MESSAIQMGSSLRARGPICSISSIWMVVSGAISATIRSKSRMVTRSGPHWAMPVATPSEPPDTVLSGLWMSVQEMRLMPTTVCTRKAIYILLKLVMINRSFSAFSLSTPRYLGRSTTVITTSRGLKIPSTAGWAWGITFTGADIIISRTLATLMPYRLPSMVNSIISISLVPDSKRIPLLCTFAMFDTPHSISDGAARRVGCA